MNREQLLHRALKQVIQGRAGLRLNAWIPPYSQTDINTLLKCNGREAAAILHELGGLAAVW